MSLYQPSQSLTWKYSTGAGQLSIVSSLSVELGANEHVLNTVSALRNNKAVITMNVNPTQSNPMIMLIPVEMIGTGITSVDQVRGIIRTLDPITVIASCYKNDKLEGEVVNVSSSNASIEMIP
jgi:hypothetical protein